LLPHHPYSADFFMATRIRDIAVSLKELRRRKLNKFSVTDEIEVVLFNIEEKYKRSIKRDFEEDLQCLEIYHDG
jgi:hypothetical protein